MKQTCAGISRVLIAIVIGGMMTIGAAAQTEKILYSFTGGSDGGAPQGALVLDGRGNLYGTTQQGGSNSGGTVFELTPNSNGSWSEQVLYSFTGLTGNSDGAFPYGSLVFDSKGNLYGTTVFGGTSFQGTVFELSPGTNGTWTENILYNFTGGADGGAPYGPGLSIDRAGKLYGTTNTGGSNGFGVVFEVVAGSNGSWTEKVLHTFTGGDDGSYPFGGPLLVDSTGSLYGNTSQGGTHDYGVVFKMTPNANGTWTEKVLYAFKNTDGTTSPIGALAFDTHGNIYGTAYDAFELSPGSNGSWTEKPLHLFAGGSDGADPESGLVIDAAGNLYGTTNTGGKHRGTVFELSPGSNGNWTEKILHRFSPTGGDGIFPYIVNLIIDGSGHLYGTTSGGGSSGFGVVYKVTP